MSMTPNNTTSKLPLFAYKSENRLEYVYIKEEDSKLVDGIIFLLEWLSYLVRLLPFFWRCCFRRKVFSQMIGFLLITQKR